MRRKRRSSLDFSWKPAVDVFKAGAAAGTTGSAETTQASADMHAQLDDLASVAGGEAESGQESLEVTHTPGDTGRAMVKRKQKKGATVATTMLLLLKLASCEEAGGGGAVRTRPPLPAPRAMPSATSTRIPVSSAAIT